MTSDLRHGIRQWTQHRILACAVVLLLGLGIGANAVIFSIIQSLLLQPLPVRDPKNLFSVQKNRRQQVRPDTEFYYSVYEKLNQKQGVTSSLLGEQVLTDNCFFTFEQDGHARIVSSTIVSPNYFTALGVHALLGRVLIQADATATEIPAVISYQFWRSEFNGNTAVVGKLLRLKNYPFRIVGVLPRAFHSFDLEFAPDIRFPISAAPMLYGQTVEALKPSPPLTFELFARLAPGMSPKTAAAAIVQTAREADEALLRSFPVADPKMREAWEQSLRNLLDYRIELVDASRGVSKLRTQFSTTLYVLMGAALLLVVTVTANVSGLLFAHMRERAGEIAVRFAIGASRFRIVRQFLVECLLLSVPIIGIAIGFAWIATPVLLRTLPAVRSLRTSHSTPEIFDVQISSTTILIISVVSLASLFLAALVSTSRYWHSQIHTDIKRGKVGRPSNLLAAALVAVQCSLSVVLVFGAVLTSRTSWNLEHIDPGFNKTDLVELTVDPTTAGYTEEQTRGFHSELQRRITELSGIKSTAYAWSEIMRGIGMKTTMSPEGVALPSNTFMNTNVNFVSIGYFSTLGISVLAGRDFQPGDDEKKPQPLVVNSAFAYLLFPNQNPIGKFVVAGSANGRKAPTGIIVGLVGTAKYRSLREDNPPIAYSLAKTGSGNVFYAKTYRDPSQALEAIQTLVRQIDSRVPIAQATTMNQKVNGTLWQERLLTVLANFFGIITLVLAASAVYGALNHSVAVRQRELGIRMAMGAGSMDIVKSVTGRVAVTILIGMGVGIAVAASLFRLTQQLLFGVHFFDLSAIAVTIAAVSICALLAVLIPTVRAIKIDPAVALRTE